MTDQSYCVSTNSWAILRNILVHFDYPQAPGPAAQDAMTDPTPALPEPLAGFVRRCVRSIWTLETLLLLSRERGRGWSAAELTAELRSSAAAIADALSQLQAADLI